MDERIRDLVYDDLCSRMHYDVKGTIPIEVWDGEYDMIDGARTYKTMYVDVKLLGIDTNGFIEVEPLTNDKEIIDEFEHYFIDEAPTTDDFTPYYRPVSDLTEEEMDEMFDILGIDKDGNDPSWIKINDSTGIRFILPDGVYADDLIRVYDYLNSIHIDYRGFIGLGLAKEMTTNKLFKL